MKKSIIILVFLLFSLSIASSAEIDISSNYTIHYFYAQGCSHCVNVAENGILDRVDNLTGVKVIKYDVAESPQEFFRYADIFHLADDKLTRTPILFLVHEGKIDYLAGDFSIINNLEDRIKNFQGVDLIENLEKPKITLGAIIIAALIDSINPCAFGVLIFLLICLLNIGSSKRALKAGLFYSFIVFLVYFLAGLGLFRVIQSLTSIIWYVYLFIGILAVFLGITQFIDTMFPGKFISLRIPLKAKSLIERIAERATFSSILVLGILVSLFELPCTGGIYIAILATMSINQTFGIGYLLLYNLIFVLPLVIITFLIYKGTKPEVLQKWTSNERGWMKLASGVVMVLLGVYILLNL